MRAVRKVVFACVALLPLTATAQIQRSADLPNADLPGNGPSLPNSNLPGPVPTVNPLVLPSTDNVKEPELLQAAIERALAESQADAEAARLDAAAARSEAAAARDEA